MRVRWISLLCLCGSVLVAGPALGQGMPDQPMPAPPSEDTSAPAPEDPAVRYDQLRSELESPKPNRRRAAATQLGQLGDPRAVPALIGALQHDKKAEVRAEAARALGLLKAEDAGGALDLASRKDASPMVRSEAANALKLLPKSAVPAPATPTPAATSAVADPSPEYYNDPQYISGRRLRLAGILTSTIGGGLGLLFGVAGYVSWSACEDDLSKCDGNEEIKDNYKNAGVFGFVLAGVALGVGVPLWIIGQKRINRAVAGQRAAYLPQVDLALGPENRRMVTARWRF